MEKNCVPHLGSSIKSILVLNWFTIISYRPMKIKGYLVALLRCTFHLSSNPKNNSTFKNYKIWRI